MRTTHLVHSLSLAAIAAVLLTVGADAADKDKDKDKGAKPDAVFAAIDANDDGSITAKELAESKRFKDASPKEVGEAFKSKDLNGDGGISEHEFNKTFGSEKGDKGKGKGHKGGKGEGKKGGKGKGKAAK